MPEPADSLVPPDVLTIIDGRPRLLGARCSACREVRFPPAERCLACGGENMDVFPMAERGTLWTWTVQRFPPKAPPYVGPTDAERFRPFAVGYVELPNETRVEARITGCALEDLAFDLPLQLTVEALDPDRPAERLTFAFQPAVAGAART